MNQSYFLVVQATNSYFTYHKGVGQLKGKIAVGAIK